MEFKFFSDYYIPSGTMANKKRKTLQIKRPDSKAPSAKKKALPKVEDSEAGDAAAAGPKTAKVARPDSGEKATRLELPNEDKIRQARKANASQDLEKESALPGAEQVADIQNNATMPIEIDAESVGSGATTQLPDLDNKDDSDKTMQIDAAALEADEAAVELQKAEAPDLNDQTMQIDASAIEEADSGETMEVTGAVEAADDTMEIDPSLSLEATQDLESQVADNDLQSMETMQMDPASIEQAAASIEEATGKDDLEESFNAQTMAMDPEALERELAASTSKQEDVSDDDANATMDLSQSERPKTIIIKRPSSAPNAPTVKASRPAPGGGPRPVTANQSQPKEGTSRIDVPAGDENSKEGKTIKLRRPSGAPSAAPSKVATVAKQAGLELNADGTVTAKAPQEKPLGGGWLAVAIVTLLVSAGALWVVIAPSQPELPMAGRLVDVNNRLILR